MHEVTIRLRFNRECLGAARRHKGPKSVIFCMDRDPAGRVMFMPGAWLSVMRYAAKLRNQHHELVKKIDWDPIIVGEPRPGWRRTIVDGGGQGQGERKRIRYAVHEAFRSGDVISVNAVLPDGLETEDFWGLLDIAGRYRGFSPFNNDSDKYGTFEVISIDRRARRPGATVPEIKEPAGG